MVTKYQFEFVTMIEAGMSPQEIADKLFVDVDSVKQYTYRLRKKYKAKTTQEVIEIIKRGYVE